MPSIYYYREQIWWLSGYDQIDDQIELVECLSASRFTLTFQRADGTNGQASVDNFRKTRKAAVRALLTRAKRDIKEATEKAEHIQTILDGWNNLVKDREQRLDDLTKLHGVPNGSHQED